MKAIKFFSLVLVFGLMTQMGSAITPKGDDGELSFKSKCTCQHTLKAALKDIDGVKKVSVCTKSGNAKVSYDKSKTSQDVILTALTQAGHVEKSEADKCVKAKSDCSAKCSKSKSDCGTKKTKTTTL